MINPAACAAVKEGKSDHCRGGMFVGLRRIDQLEARLGCKPAAEKLNKHDEHKNGFSESSSFSSKARAVAEALALLAASCRRSYAVDGVRSC
jgi:hypothetical protein